MEATTKPRSVKHTPLADASRSARVGLRSSEAQVLILRRAAEVAHKSLTDFILDSACLAAEQTLLDQRLFMTTGKDHQALLDLLDRPARSNAGLKDLFSRTAPWDDQQANTQAITQTNTATQPAAAKSTPNKKPATARAHARA